MDITNYGFDITNITALPDGNLKTTLGDGSNIDSASVLLHKVFENVAQAPLPPSGVEWPPNAEQGQILVQQSATQGDVAWEDLIFSGGGA